MIGLKSKIDEDKLIKVSRMKEVMLSISYRINQVAGKAKFIKSEFGEKEF